MSISHGAPVSSIVIEHYVEIYENKADDTLPPSLVLHFVLTTIVKVDIGSFYSYVKSHSDRFPSNVFIVE